MSPVVFTSCVQEKREKQVWNKRRQILYTVEKVSRTDPEHFSSFDLTIIFVKIV